MYSVVSYHINKKQLDVTGTVQGHEKKRTN